jgi:hypothetical protein
LWKKLTESRLRESEMREAAETLVQGSDRGRSGRKLPDKPSEPVVGQMRESAETLVEGSDRGQPRRKLADKDSGTVGGDRDREELQDKHMDTS